MSWRSTREQCTGGFCVLPQQKQQPGLAGSLSRIRVLTLTNVLASADFE